jgi:RND family efflux transporter MFP subunit
MLPLTACGNNDAAAAVPPISYSFVSTITPQIGDIVVIGEYIGTIQPNQQVSVIPGIPGEVKSVHFAVGDRVEAGDILFTIDSADIITNINSLEAQLAVQNAAVSAAQTNIQLVDGSAMQSQLLTASSSVNQAEAAISQAEAAISQAEQNAEQARIGVEQAQIGYDTAYQALNDTTALFSAGVVARTALEQAETAHLNAQSALDRAKSGYYIAAIGLSQAQQGQIQAQQGHVQALEGLRIIQEQTPAENRQRAQDGLVQAQAARNTVSVNLEAANVRLDDAIVRAPISGVVTMRNIDEFGFATPQSPAFVISEQDSMTVSFRVPGNSIVHLQLGDTITLYHGNAYHIGIITEIPVLVDQSGLLTIRAGIANPPGTLLGGTSVRVFADAHRASNVIIVPLNAIHYDRGVPHVYIAENGHARRVQIEIGIFDARYAEVVYGVDTNSQIISTWSARLSDGTEVQIVQNEGE